MPIQTFTCGSCGEFDRILSRTDYDRKQTDTCPECGAVSPAKAVPLPSKRNPAHGIQR